MIAQRSAIAVLIRAANALPAPIAARLGHNSHATRLMRPLVNCLMPARYVEAVVRSGPGRGIVLPIQPRAEKFYWTGAYELGVQETLVRLLRPGAIVWDVGAHIGFFSALAARCVSPGGHVHAFEPLPANRTRLRRTIELNGIREIHVHPLAVASAAGAQELYGHPSTSMWSLVERTGAQRVEVPCTTLDGLLADGSFGVPALVKIDAEGAELDILRGAGRLLTETPATLVIEFHDERNVAEARSLLPSRVFEALSNSHWLLRAP